MQLEGIDHVAMGVRDVERSAKWYTEVLGFERLHEGVWGGVRPLSEKENTGIALFQRARSKPSGHAKFECFTSPFARTAKIFSLHSAELEKRGIKFEFQDHEISHPSIFMIPTVTNSRSRPTSSIN